MVFIFEAMPLVERIAVLQPERYGAQTYVRAIVWVGTELRLQLLDLVASPRDSFGATVSLNSLAGAATMLVSSVFRALVSPGDSVVTSGLGATANC